MTPKEKAKELINKFKLSTSANTKINIYVAKQCALIAVDEMINYLNLNGFSTQIDYWQEVKQEIINI